MNEEEKNAIERMQRGDSELFEKRQQALEKVCPHCWGNLVALDMGSIFCPVCQIRYTVEEILKGATK